MWGYSIILTRLYLWTCRYITYSWNMVNTLLQRMSSRGHGVQVLVHALVQVLALVLVVNTFYLSFMLFSLFIVHLFKFYVKLYCISTLCLTNWEILYTVDTAIDFTFGWSCSSLVITIYNSMWYVLLWSRNRQKAITTIFYCCYLSISPVRCYFSTYHLLPTNINDGRTSELLCL